MCCCLGFGHGGCRLKPGLGPLFVKGCNSVTDMMTVLQGYFQGSVLQNPMCRPARAAPPVDELGSAPAMEQQSDPLWSRYISTSTAMDACQLAFVLGSQQSILGSPGCQAGGRSETWWQLQQLMANKLTVNRVVAVD